MRMRRYYFQMEKDADLFKISACAIIPASFTAIFNIIPFFFPFLSPRKISIAHFAFLLAN